MYNLQKGLIPVCRFTFSFSNVESLKILKKLCILILILLLIIFICISFSRKDNIIPEEVLSFYDNFLSSYTNGTFADVDSFLYYQRPEYWKLNEDDFSNLTDYEIIGWERINHNLWAVNVFLETEYESDGYTCYHFLGYINNKLYVMIGVYQIPESLIGGSDLSRFIPQGVLPAENTIIFN